MRRTWTRAAVALLAIAPGPLTAQTPERNPHGPLPETLSCLDCHSERAWAPLRRDPTFDHGGTDFPLDGRHADVACAGCHAELSFEIALTAPDDCASCHLDVHLGTPTRPCVRCHTTATFDELPPGLVHPADFPLEGAHLQTACESCHSDDLAGAFSPPDRECATCHMNDYLSAPLVDHQRLGFSTDCTECHTALDFRDVPFDHFTISGGFELVGRHAGIECTSCHSLPDGGLPWMPAGPQDCISCHRDDYEEEHAGSGFGTDCLACHREDSWDGATFDHSFPITSGPHSDRACIECHTTPEVFTTFTCLTCHGLGEMNDKHGEVAGYAYESASCLSCHPDGRS